MKVDYYETLQLHRSASETEIKKAYRKLALRWHPDKNPTCREDAKKRFQEISQAYEVLSDSNKRQIYDRHGAEGLVHAAPQENGSVAGQFGDPIDPFGSFFSFGPFHSGFAFRDPFEVFREFFGGQDPFAEMFGDDFLRPQRARAHNSLFGFPFAAFDPFSLRLGFEPHLSLTNGRSAHAHADPLHQLRHAHSHHHHRHVRATPEHQRGFTSFTSFSSSSDGHHQIKRTSSTTRFVGGKKIVTKKIHENGVETVIVTEDGRVKRKTVNGIEEITLS